MKKLYLYLFLDICVFGNDISFEYLKHSAHENSHRLKLRSIDTTIEEARLDSIYSTLYPQLSFGYNGEYNHNLDTTAEGVSVGGTVINSTISNKDSISLKMNYELYHFGTTLKQIEMSKNEIAAKKLEACNEETKLHKELLDHYATAQKSQSEYRYKSQMHTLRQELYTLKQRLYTAGKESRISVGDEAIRLIDLERDIERARMSYDENLIALSKLSHIDLNLKETQLLPLNTNPEEIRIGSFEESSQAHQYQEKILQKNNEISMNERSQLPVISLYYNYYFYGSDKHNAYDAFSNMKPNSWNTGLSVQWNLFEGFKYNHESARLHYERDRLYEEYALAKREFDANTQTKQQRLQRLAILTKNETEALNETRSKMKMTQRLREQGEADAVSEVSVKLENLERELTLQTESIQHAYEAESLKLQHRGVEECRFK
ncbi:TolC family protein [Sulfuricurvum sp.]|uniref:TolC family protein n=1 Tax=Sulfuricurvum sp. TaxID=2025608 RepID=UPI003BB5571F